MDAWRIFQILLDANKTPFSTIIDTSDPMLVINFLSTKLDTIPDHTYRNNSRLWAVLVYNIWNQYKSGEIHQVSMQYEVPQNIPSINCLVTCHSG